jgi:hypothetical protein
MGHDRESWVEGRYLQIRDFRLLFTANTIERVGGVFTTVRNG